MADPPFRKEEAYLMKKHFIAIVILIVLIGIYYFVQKHETSMVAPKSVENFLNVDTLAVNKITIGRFGGGVTLSRAGDIWYVVSGETYKADAVAVNQLLDALLGMKAGNVISDNPQNQIKFQVDTLTGVTVTFYSGENPLNAIVVGKMSNDFRHTYVRLRDQNEVYLGEGMLTHMLTRSASDWRDHTIFDISQSDVQSVEFNTYGENYRVTLEDTIWTLSKAPFDESVEIDRYKVNGLLVSLCALDASDFARPRDTTEYDFSDLGYVATLMLSDGSSRAIEVATNIGDSKRYFARIPEDPTIFILNEGAFGNIAKSSSELLPE